MAIRCYSIPGGRYVDALPDGRYAALVADTFRTHLGHVPFPPIGGVLHHRVGLIDGVFCIAGQAHTGGLAMLWNGWQWKELCPSYGTSVACFGPLGVYVSAPYAQDNIRIFNLEGKFVASISKPVGARGIALITGAGADPEDIHGVDAWYGRDGLAEYVECDGYLIGQGANGGLVIKHDAGVPSLIEPGHVEFCRAEFDGLTFVASAWKTLEHQSVICWFRTDELPSLPRVAVPHVPTEPDGPDVPDQPEEPIVSIPDFFHIVKAVDAARPHLLQKNDHDSVKEFYWRAAWALHQADPRFGMLSKSGGETGQEIPGAGRVAEDAIAYKDVTPIIDIIAGANNPGQRAAATWQFVEARRESNQWVKPPAFPESGGDTGGDPDWQSAVQAVRNDLQDLRNQVSADNNALTQLHARVDALEHREIPPVDDQRLETMIIELLRRDLRVEVDVVPAGPTLRFLGQPINLNHDHGVDVRVMLRGVVLNQRVTAPKTAARDVNLDDEGVPPRD